MGRLVDTYDLKVEWEMLGRGEIGRAGVWLERVSQSSSSSLTINFGKTRNETMGNPRQSIRV